MHVYLLRSSSAFDDSPQTPPNHRYLSAEGRQLIRALGTRLKLNEEPNVDRMVVSPLPAAVQTAEIFAERIDYLGVIETLPILGSEAPPSVVVPLLLARGESVVVVADEPVLSTLGAFLVGRPTFPPLLHGQVSVIVDRQPAWCFRPGEVGRSLLLVA